ncbi:hypothetical protein SH2C18_24040 [Clostridium sediminicola]|uniref:ABC transporter substrate binding protein n=1 Tax=Clostridium sediminicola TaxID=3114879 RepID=UPI0031F1E343
MMGKRLEKIVFLIIILINILFLNVTSVFAKENVEKHILILNSYHQGYTWTDNIVKGVNSILNDSNNVIRIEYMDTKMITDEEHLNNLYQLYKHKFRDSNFDVIIACDNDAYEFLKIYHDALFQNIPIVCCGLNIYDDFITNKNNLFTGIAEKVDVIATIDLACDLHPDIENIIVISDNSTFGDMNEKIAKQVVPSYKGKLNFDFIQISTIEEIIDKVKKIPKNSIILQTGIFKDEFGELIPVEKGNRIIHEAVDTPIYSYWKMHLGGGVIGGKILDGYHEGQVVAGMAKSILEGKSVSEIPFVEESSTQYVFDDNLLKEYNIKHKELPKDRIILNLPNTFFEISKILMYQLVILLIIFLVYINFARFRDIKRLRVVKKELKEEKEILKSILDSTGDGILVLDTERNIIHRNDKVNEMWQIPNEFLDVKRISLLEAYIRGVVKNADALISWFIAAKGSTNDSIYTINFKDGRSFETVSKAFIIDGKLSGDVLNFRDITKKIELEQLEKEVEIKEKLLEEAKKYDQMKDQFLATISHELKTPLNIILGIIQLIEQGMAEKNKVPNMEKLNNYKNISKQNCYRLLKLINNLIDITKIDSGFMSLNLKNYNIVSVVEDISLSIVEYAQSKGITIIFDTETEEEIIAVDAEKMERVMLNLFSNAVKFTDEGGVIKVNLLRKQNSIIIRVKDSGIGIPEDMRGKIFDRFSQVDSSLSRNTEGSGIGLALVKSIVELHNGTITLNSEAGTGSEFIIEIPVVLVEESGSAKNEIAETTINTNVENISIEFSDIYS